MELEFAKVKTELQDLKARYRKLLKISVCAGAAAGLVVLALDHRTKAQAKTIMQLKKDLQIEGQLRQDWNQFGEILLDVVPVTREQAFEVSRRWLGSKSLKK